MKLEQKVWKLGHVTTSSPAILLIHGNKFCKEIWHPVVRHLSRLCMIADRSAVVIAIDLPGCGDSRPIDFDIPADWFAVSLPGIHKVVAEHKAGGRPFFGVGHSFGAVLVMACEADSPGTFTRILAYEPVLPPPGRFIPRNLLTKQQLQKLASSLPFVQAVIKQPKVFKSREEAFQAFRCVSRFSLIPDDVIRIYVEHGLEDVPDGSGRVTLKLDPAIEADRHLAKRLLTEDDVVTMAAPCAFAYGSRSEYGQVVAGTATRDWMNNLARKFSGDLAPPWEAAGATHMLPLENAERVAHDIQRLVWFETASADKAVQSKL